jgi:excisionase family DNA binding protein
MQHQGGAVTDRYLTREEVAALTRLHINTVDRAIRNGDLEHGGTAGRVRIKPEWVDVWLRRRATTTPTRRKVG